MKNNYSDYEDVTDLVNSRFKSRVDFDNSSIVPDAEGEDVTALVGEINKAKATKSIFSGIPKPSQYVGEAGDPLVGAKKEAQLMGTNLWRFFNYISKGVTGESFVDPEALKQEAEAVRPRGWGEGAGALAMDVLPMSRFFKSANTLAGSGEKWVSKQIIPLFKRLSPSAQKVAEGTAVAIPRVGINAGAGAAMAGLVSGDPTTGAILQGGLGFVSPLVGKWIQSNAPKQAAKYENEFIDALIPRAQPQHWRETTRTLWEGTKASTVKPFWARDLPTNIQKLGGIASANRKQLGQEIDQIILTQIKDQRLDAKPILRKMQDSLEAWPRPAMGWIEIPKDKFKAVIRKATGKTIVPDVIPPQERMPGIVDVEFSNARGALPHGNQGLLEGQQGLLAEAVPARRITGMPKKLTEGQKAENALIEQAVELGLPPARTMIEVTTNTGVRKISFSEFKAMTPASYKNYRIVYEMPVIHGPEGAARVRAMRNLQQNVLSYGDLPEARHLIALKRMLGFDVAQTHGWTNKAKALSGVEIEGSSWANKEGQKAIMEMLDNKFPDYAALDKEAAWWIKLDKVLKYSASKRPYVSTRLHGVIGAGAGAASGAAIDGALGASLGGILGIEAAQLVQRAFSSQSWKLMSVLTRKRFADAMMRQDVKTIKQIATQILATEATRYGTNNNKR